MQGPLLALTDTPSTLSPPSAAAPPATSHAPHTHIKLVSPRRPHKYKLLHVHGVKRNVNIHTHSRCRKWLKGRSLYKSDSISTRSGVTQPCENVGLLQGNSNLHTRLPSCRSTSFRLTQGHILQQIKFSIRLNLCWTENRRNEQVM